MTIKIEIYQTKDIIYMSIATDTEQSLSWEVLQGIKNMYYPDLDFVEAYPKKEKAINKANERHLFHTIFPVPDLSHLEDPNFKQVL